MRRREPAARHPRAGVLLARPSPSLAARKPPEPQAAVVARRCLQHRGASFPRHPARRAIHKDVTLCVVWVCGTDPEVPLPEPPCVSEREPARAARSARHVFICKSCRGLGSKTGRGVWVSRGQTSTRRPWTDVNSLVHTHGCSTGHIKSRPSASPGRARRRRDRCHEGSRWRPSPGSLAQQTTLLPRDRRPIVMNMRTG